MQTKALFLDRDGVINIDHGYAAKPEEIDFIDDVFALCARFQQYGYLILVVTNQSGIGRGYYSEEDFLQLSEWMTSEFHKRGIEVTDFFYCPHHPTKATGKYLQNCDCRKPNSGMFEQAKEKYNLDMQSSFMIGDKLSDMIAAHGAGVANRFLFVSNDSVKENEAQIQFELIHSLKQVVPK